MGENLAYYLEKYYRVEIKEIPDEDGGGFVASLPQFGHSGIIADGDTPEEAIQELEKVKALRFKNYLEEGLEIPVPEDELSVNDFSGRFVIRMPSFLHRDLAEEAKKSGVSLNLLINNFLSSGLEIKKTFSYVEEIKQTIELVRESVCSLKRSTESAMLSNFKLSANFKADEYEEDYKAVA